ncbi:unnamed protein product [Anisakis simplex]|uniref:Uncharacterized protein n=1 Tax=Anisakis simplex TaxID=6269 RepID=A0A0M3IZG6_ANISI|nr:unnamed protein product [Anisakis simplex]
MFQCVIKEKILFVYPRSREIKIRSEQISCQEIRINTDFEIAVEWNGSPSYTNEIFDAPPITELSDERIQWTLDQLEDKSDTWNHLSEQKTKSTIDNIRDEMEQTMISAGIIIDKSSHMIAQEIQEIARYWQFLLGSLSLIGLTVTIVITIIMCPQCFTCFNAMCQRCVMSKRTSAQRHQLSTLVDSIGKFKIKDAGMSRQKWRKYKRR